MGGPSTTMGPCKGRGFPGRVLWHASWTRDGRVALACNEYRRREPELTLLYSVVQSHLATFLADACERTEAGLGYPRFIEREFTRYLECGILAHGFARVHCDDCGHDLLVAFSCRGRAVCPSCNARRMHDTAAHLVDRVLPDVPVRQWVLSLPRWIRYRLAYRPALTTQVLSVFLRTVFAWQRRRARAIGVQRSQAGAVTFVQRFGSALNLNTHFHALVPDGVFVKNESGATTFVALTRSTREEIDKIIQRVAIRVLRVIACARIDEDVVSADGHADPYESAGRPERGLTKSFVDERPRSNRRAAFLEGFSLDANVSIGANKRDALERLCRYGARPPIALSRLSEAENGNLNYRLKHHAPGTPDRLVFTPIELLGKLAALIPPPRVHVTRYHGVFAPNAKWRAQIVRAEIFAPAAPPERPHAAPPPPASRRRFDWATLLKRVFAIDVLECRRCGGRLRVIACITDPDVASAILTSLDLPTTAPILAPARAPPISDFADLVVGD